MGICEVGVNRVMIIETMFKDAQWFKKKPVKVRAIQITQPFQVITLEGIMTGKEGDYLIEGVKKELYPCDKDIFEATYEEI
jgi:hypothetical protein